LENAGCPIVQVWSGEQYKTIADRYPPIAAANDTSLPNLLHRFAIRDVLHIAPRRRRFILPVRYCSPENCRRFPVGMVLKLSCNRF